MISTKTAIDTSPVTLLSVGWLILCFPCSPMKGILQKGREDEQSEKVLHCGDKRSFCPPFQTAHHILLPSFFHFPLAQHILITLLDPMQLSRWLLSLFASLWKAQPNSSSLPSTHTHTHKPTHTSSKQHSFSEMVKAGGIFVCILIIGLDIAAGILGLEAEVEQNKVNLN